MRSTAADRREARWLAFLLPGAVIRELREPPRVLLPLLLTAWCRS